MKQQTRPWVRTTMFPSRACYLVTVCRAQHFAEQCVVLTAPDSSMVNATTCGQSLGVLGTVNGNHVVFSSVSHVDHHINPTTSTPYTTITTITITPRPSPFAMPNPHHRHHQCSHDLQSPRPPLHPSPPRRRLLPLRLPMCMRCLRVPPWLMPSSTT